MLSLLSLADLLAYHGLMMTGQIPLRHLNCDIWTKTFMTLTQLLILLLIAAICGGVGQSLAGYSLGGCLVSIVVGFIGAYIGMWLAGKLGLPEMLAIKVGGKTFPVIWAVIGSAVFTLIVALIRRAVSGTRNYY